MKCPNCNTAMRQIEYEGMPVWTCAGCKGEFLDGKRLKYIERKKEVQFESAERNILKYGKTGPEKEKKRICPRCEKPMSKGRYRATDVIIDHCKSCQGVWLDDRELEKVQVLGEAGKTEPAAGKEDRMGLVEAVMAAHDAVKKRRRRPK